jgi:hypothetical protein
MIPRHTKPQVDAYIDEGIPPGDFLYACLTNDLRTAVSHADDINRWHIYDIVVYLEYHIPNMAWGSTERVKSWLAFHRENPAFIKRAIEYDKLKRETYYERLRGSDTVDG